MGKTPALEASSSSRGVGKSGISGFGIFSKQGWKLGYDGKLQEIPLGYSSLHLLQPTPIPKIGADPLENLWIPMSRTFQGISQSLILYTLKFPQFSFFFPPKKQGKKAQVMGIVLLFPTTSENSRQGDAKSKIFFSEKILSSGKLRNPDGIFKGKIGNIGNSIRPPPLSPRVSRIFQGLRFPASRWKFHLEKRDGAQASLGFDIPADCFSRIPDPADPTNSLGFISSPKFLHFLPHSYRDSN